MTHTGPLPDAAGDFGQWVLTERACVEPGCTAPVRVRVWESHDGAYEDAQYRCDKGHVRWVDGIDS